MSRRTDELKQRWPKGAMAPACYCDWHEWAEAQGLHGLKQDNCRNCGRYCFPQELTILGTCVDRAECEEFVKKNGKLQLVSL